MTFTERVIEEALKQVGAPYIWAGKGNALWTPAGLEPHTRLPTNLVFDCSGLVTWAIWKAGGPDWRAAHNQSTLLAMLRLRDGKVDLTRPHLRYYGIDKEHTSHIALALGRVDTRTLVVEAAGGGPATRSPHPGAQVFCHFEQRADCVDYTLLPLF